ncbi:PepSY-associated TM helix domain-containing protein [Pseudokordiimonas caeni]|uniref:PepSY-associated TM helix domain-containing protein n=1 Tax=Pseudokordiimonas caeni TaxID=2997908 RepID=UPI0028115133|nr:PepSY-associated TM helix domain-containing protein [Pseudokordiimonas caeni]
MAKGRSIWWLVHHWAGMKVSLFLTFILATGTLAVLSAEIDWLINPEMRVESREGPVASWGELVAAGLAAAPEGARLERISEPRDPWFAAEMLVVDAGGTRQRIFINPWTADVQGLLPWFNAQRLFRELHRHLMLPVKVGLPFVAILSLPMLASAITAFVVYKRWWRGFFKWPASPAAKRGSPRRFYGDLHRLAGVWSLWFVLLIGLTGLWYLVEWGGGNAPQPERRGEVLPAIEQIDAATLDAAIAVAQADYPTLHITSLYFPEGKPGGLVVMGQADALLVRERANAVLVDPATMRVVQRLRGEDLTVHQRISEAADPLHFGTFGGFWVRLLWFLFGMLLTLLAVTGILIYARRLAPKATVTGPAPGALARMWVAMGPFAWPSATLCSIGLVMAAVNIAAG